MIDSRELVAPRGATVTAADSLYTVRRAEKQPTVTVRVYKRVVSISANDISECR
jgi:hypothetical protein